MSRIVEFVHESQIFCFYPQDAVCMTNKTANRCFEGIFLLEFYDSGMLSVGRLLL